MINSLDFRAGLALRLTGALLVAAAPLRAETDAVGESARLDSASTSPYGVTYDPTPGCPAARDFLAAVRRRVAKAFLVDASRASFIVRIDVAEGARAELLTRESPGTVVRSVTATECKEAASAIALVTAIAMEARASGREAPPPSMPTTAETSRPKGSTPPAARLLDSREDRPEADRAPPGVFRENATPRSAGLRLGVEAAGSVRSAFAPSLGWGASVLSTMKVGPSWVLGAGMSVLSSQWSEQQSVADVRATLLTARLTACHPIWQPSFTLAGCTSLELGAVHAVARPRESGLRGGSDVAPWFAPGLTLQARTPKLSDFDMFGEVGGIVPLARRSYDSEQPDARLYALELGFTGSLGAAAHFY